ncbi:N-acetylmuramoyl-L-alanine amidase [Xanthobacter sp. TB0139]|uniref:N-acetylmuramoyl-L-alanine amidase n=1 Tax=Xanthobacter sp. TB0139 TaxID=3459178 RepID=UPI00403A2D8C
MDQPLRQITASGDAGAVSTAIRVWSGRARHILPLLLATLFLCITQWGAHAETPPDASDTATQTSAHVTKQAVAQQTVAQQTAIAQDARLAGDDSRTRLIVDLDRTVDIRAFTLANPPRVVIDLKNVHFHFQPEPEARQRGLISTYRFGVFAPGKARMVLDATGPVAIDKTYILDAVDDQPARLVVDLIKSDADQFVRDAASAAARQPVEEPAMAAASSVAPLAKQERASALPVVVLDPGHGGIDSGTTGYSRFTEKNIVLETALALRRKLEETGRYKVVMTRESDTFIALGERVRIAREHQADLFISIHADALARGDGNASGASVYTLSEKASDADAARLAEKENKADLIAGIDLSDETDAVADILLELAHRETRSFSARFARELVSNMKGRVNTHGKPLKSARFRVLRAHDVPSVLVELGYMSNRKDLRQLTSETWRDRMSDAMMAAIEHFFSERHAVFLSVDSVETTGSIPNQPRN